MSTSKVVVVVLLLCLLASACAPKVVEVEKVVKETVVVERVVEKEVQKVVKETVVVEKVERSADSGASAASGSASGPSASWGAGGMPYQVGRKIIKDGEMTLVVADTDRAIDDVTRIAVMKGGYLLALEVTLREGLKFAKIVLGVPVQEFENVQRQMRAIAVRVLRDYAVGVDVTEEYVDTQSRLANLEATQARIREFLEQANTVEESLRVNAKLAEIEAEIEQVKGRLNYLRERAAYSTLRIDLEPEHPSPTPTATPTVTPTPTATPTLTPIYWRPGETFDAAARTLTGVTRTLGDVAIWLIVVAPLWLPVPAVIVLVWWLRRRRRGAQKTEKTE